MKAEILLQTFLAQGDLQFEDGKAENNSKSRDDTNNFKSLPYDRQYIKNVEYL